jgi:hypothetical protein
VNTYYLLLLPLLHFMAGLGVPPPSAAWLLDGSQSSAINGAPVQLQGQCNWTRGFSSNHSLSLRLGGGCTAHAAHGPAMSGLGTGSLTTCMRFRATARGVALVSKGLLRERGGSAPSLQGFRIEVGEERGLGIALADRLGVSVHEEIGRASLSDGSWHHVCAVLQRPPHGSLLLYVDGRLSESLRLHGSHLQWLGSVASEAPLTLGAQAGGQLVAPTEVGGLSEVALWSRALLPEHIHALSARGLTECLRRRGASRHQVHGSDVGQNSVWPTRHGSDHGRTSSERARSIGSDHRSRLQTNRWRAWRLSLAHEASAALVLGTLIGVVGWRRRCRSRCQD